MSEYSKIYQVPGELGRLFNRPRDHFYRAGLKQNKTLTNAKLTDFNNLICDSYSN